MLLEALACGKPVVAGANPGYAGVLQGKGAMGLVNPKDTVEFARRLQLFLTDKDLQELLTDWALEYVKQYDYEQIVDQYEKLFLQIKSNPKRDTKS